MPSVPLPQRFRPRRALQPACVSARASQDAMCVARNVALDPKLVPGGGAVEMAVAAALTEKSKSISGVHQWPYRAVAQALEVPRRARCTALEPALPMPLGTVGRWGSGAGAQWGGQRGSPEGPSLVKPASVVHP
jgi:hypothetical protein